MSLTKHIGNTRILAAVVLMAVFLIGAAFGAAICTATCHRGAPPCTARFHFTSWLTAEQEKIRFHGYCTQSSCLPLFSG